MKQWNNGMCWMACYNMFQCWIWSSRSRCPCTNHLQTRHPHDDAIKWKHFPRYCAFVRGIHRSPVNSPHKGQWRRALMFSLICAWTKVWVNNRDVGDLRRHSAHFEVTLMLAVLMTWIERWWLLITKIVTPLAPETIFALRMITLWDINLLRPSVAYMRQ